MAKLKLINSITIETYYGFKDFTLLYGDVCEQVADLLIISAHAGKGEPSGGVIHSLKQRYRLFD